MGRYQKRSGGQQMSTGQQSQFDSNDWPTEFPKCVIGIDRDGVIVEWKNIIKRYEDVNFIDGSLEAIRKLRLIGHSVVLFADQPNVHRGLLTTNDVSNVMNHVMRVFGDNGIFTLDGFYFNGSDDPQDPFAKPNIGMMNRSMKELDVDFSEGYYVGDTIEDIQMAIKVGSKPILVRTGKGKNTEEKYLKSFDTKYKDVQVFDNLLDFVNTL
jgi:D-glycero-D-manno-heptose 1,7-bisphosphate phosphatase